MTELKTAKDLQEDYDSAISEIANDTRENAWKDAMRVVLNYVTRIDAAETALVAANATIERLSAPVSDELLEELAALEHERWSGQAIAALTDMTDARRERWTRQARLLYVGLTEAEKEQDRKQVRKTLAIIAARKAAQ